MDQVKRFAFATILVVGTLALGFAATDTLRGDGPHAYDTVEQLMQDLPTEQRVTLTANVSQVLEDHESDSGNVYQQFYITNGEAEVLVFCGTFDGRINVSVGDMVRVGGEFQKFYDTYEIYTECGRIDRVA